MVFLWFSWVFPSYSYGLPKTQRPTVTDGSLTETDGKTQRVNVTDGSLTETDGSLTDMHRRGGQWSRRRRAAVRWILGLCWAGVLVCRCVGVPVCKCAGDRGGAPMLPLISL